MNSILYQTEHALVMSNKPFKWGSLLIGSGVRGGLGHNVYIDKNGFYLVHRGSTYWQRFWLSSNGLISLLWKNKVMSDIQKKEAQTTQAFEGKSPQDLMMMNPENKHIRFETIKKVKFSRWGKIQHPLDRNLKMKILIVKTQNETMSIWLPSRDIEKVKTLLMTRLPIT